MALLRFQPRVLWMALVILIPATLFAGVTLDIGFSNPRFQVFVIGDVINPGVLESGGSIDLDAFAKFFYMQVSATPDLASTKAYIHFYENLGGVRLVDYWSERTADKAFPLSAWMQNSSDGVGKYWNTDVKTIESSGWFHRDQSQSSFSDVNAVLGQIDNGLFKSNTFTVGLEVFSQNGNRLGTLTRSIQVYNPSSPALSSPMADAQVQPNTPVNFNWSWASGGPTAPSDWTLIVVDGGTSPQDDGDAVIRNRTAANTRFEGEPQSASGHNYTGNGAGEAQLVIGEYYYWQVTVKAPTILDAGTKGYSSPVRCFQVNTPLENIQGYNSRLYRAYFVTGELGGLIQDNLDKLKGYVPVSIERDDNETNVENLIKGLADPLKDHPETISKELRQ